MSPEIRGPFELKHSVLLVPFFLSEENPKINCTKGRVHSLPLYTIKQRIVSLS
jgi:hypothetical protein